MKNTRQYVHSLIQTPVMIAAEPEIPVMKRWVRLLYFVIVEATLVDKKLKLQN